MSGGGRMSYIQSMDSMFDNEQVRFEVILENCRITIQCRRSRWQSAPDSRAADDSATLSLVANPDFQGDLGCSTVIQARSTCIAFSQSAADHRTNHLRKTTQLQYIEDSEPVDKSRDQWRAVQ